MAGKEPAAKYTGRRRIAPLSLEQQSNRGASLIIASMSARFRSWQKEHLKQEELAQVAIDKFTGGVSDILIDTGLRARHSDV
jgi:hypothetical protein